MNPSSRRSGAWAGFVQHIFDAVRALIGASLISALLVLALGSLVAAFAAWFLWSTPDGRDLDQCITTKMFEVNLCAGSPSYVRLSQISKHVQNAVIVSEDGSFYDHNGIDWAELRSSFETNLKRRRFARGGSTITQQLAKNVYLTPDKTLIRKIREALIARRIEKLYSKPFILEKYLNVVEFGPKVFGVKAAARLYFNKTPAELDLAEAAWLAMLLPNPEKYGASFRVRRMTSFATRRMSQILDRISARGKADALDVELAKEKARSLFGLNPIVTVESGESEGPASEPAAESSSEAEGPAGELEDELNNWEE